MESTPGDETATDTDTVTATADLARVANAPTTATVGQPFTYTFVVTNNGRTGTLRHSFYAFDTGFAGGVDVAAVDADIVTAPGTSGGPNVRVFEGLSLALLESSFAGSASFLGGVLVG